MRTRIAIIAAALATTALAPLAMAQSTSNPSSPSNPPMSMAPATQPPGTTAAPGTTSGPAASQSRAGTATQGAPLGSTAGTTHTQTGGTAGNTTGRTDNGQSAVRTDNHGNAPATTATPASGANSFTEGQARSRIEAAGFTGVQDLKKDEAGVWRGRAMRGGQSADVGLDFQGNVVTGAAPAR
ncbi:hypothetical protein [Roseomonas indoligenes]|uniref:PepSY domain-containing protein n=1 Tax=Roseomonas indoligenes TaxID=2820811 RepID=A0A940S817_9PROT|nr:hypothetical protein [Pararoseomonas indoligenes]MBP0493647.1 hypothetical protein [Pararoseomonas indoligenes]